MVERTCAAVLFVCLLLSTGAAAAERKDAVDPADWRKVAIDRALDEAAQIRDPYRRAELLAGIARAQSLIDDPAAERTTRAALTVSKDIVEPTFQGWVLHEIVLVQLASNDLAGARLTAQSIRSQRPLGAALAAIASAQLRSGSIDAAAATAAKIKDKGSAGEVLRQIVAVQAASGDLGAARKSLRAIDDDFYRAVASADIAVAEVRAGNLESAVAMAASAPRSGRPQVYERIASTLADSGEVRTAMEVSGKIGDPIEQALVRGRIAVRVAEGDPLAGRKLLAEVADRIEQAPEKRLPKAVAWARLARLQVMAGDPAAARQSLARGEAAVESIAEGSHRDHARDLIGRSRIRIGDSQGALTDAAGMEDRVSQALLVRDAVAAQADSGDAVTLLSHPAVGESALTRTAALFGVIGAQLLRKDEVRRDPEVIGINISAARVSVREIEDAQIRPAAFAALAAASVTIGHADAGRELFDEALRSAASLSLPEQRAAACIRAVNALDERLLFLGQPAAES